ncbi:MAG TPA: hypothetical protein VGI54_02000, partial [Solirubrobacteraceae bacterium]
ILDDSLRALAAEAAQGEERLLAPLVLSADGSRQDTVHPMPASAADAVRTLLPPAAVPGRVGVWLAPWRARAPRRVGWAVGCALAGRTETLRRLGPFDEAIFLYGEDMDLGLRAARAGVPTVFWPAARLIHHAGHAAARAFGGEPYERRAQARRTAVSRHHGRRGRLVDDAAQALTFAGRGALKRALGRDAAREAALLDALRAARRG